MPTEKQEGNDNSIANVRPAGMSEDERDDNFMFEVLLCDLKYTPNRFLVIFETPYCPKQRNLTNSFQGKGLLTQVYSPMDIENSPHHLNVKS